MDRFGPNTAEVERYIEIVGGLSEDQVHNVLSAKHFPPPGFDRDAYYTGQSAVTKALGKTKLIIHAGALNLALSFALSARALSVTDRAQFIPDAAAAARALVVRDYISERKFASAVSLMKRTSGISFDGRL